MFNSSMGLQRFSCILILTLFMSIQGIHAQRHFNFFYGKVLDESTRKPLYNVNIRLLKSNRGTVSDLNGDFSFYTDTIPVFMSASHLGYSTKTVLLDGTSYSLTLYLAPSVRMLPEVEIKAAAHEAVFQSRIYDVRDYEIDSGRIYLLLYNINRFNYELVCTGLKGDTLARSGVLTFTPRKLFLDCLGYLHILSHDTAYQIYLQEDQMLLIHPASMKKFDEVLLNCIASTTDNLYFRRMAHNGLEAEYYGIDKKTLKQKTLAQVRDEKKLNLLSRNKDDASLLSSSEIPDDRQTFVDWNFVHKILYRPVESSLFRSGDFIAIINIPENQVEFYDRNGAFSGKLVLKTGDIEGRWTHEILVDEVSGDVYTCGLKNGICSIYRIDLNDGSLHHRATLEHSFPQKLQAYNGFIFYLYNIPGEADNKTLFRQRL